MTEDNQESRIIKKYPNRRLYDTKKSQYITLQAVKDLVLEEVPLIVVDQKTEEDITRSILLQIILEQESDSNPLFSNENLEKFIRYYGSGPHKGFSEFIGQSLIFFQEQQQEFGKAMEGMTGLNPMTFWSEMTQKNLDSWSQMMGLGSDKKDSD